MQLKRVLLKAWLFICAASVCLNCNTPRPANAVAPVAPQQVSEPQTHVASGMSVLDDKKTPAVSTVTGNLKDKTDLHSVYFPSDREGWVGGDGKLYKTDDGGKTWTQVPIEMPQGASVTHILFINPTLGWVVLQRSDTGAPNELANRFWLMGTTDGGKNWQALYEGDESIASSLIFADEANGWLAGTKFTGVSPVRYTYLLLHTSDRGAHWTDVSEGLKKITAQQRQRPSDAINSSIMGVVTGGPTQATVVTGAAKVFETLNRGADWREVASIFPDPVEMVVRHLGRRDDNSLFIAGGRGGEEGTWGGIVAEQSAGSWTSYLLGGIFVEDAILLSGNQLLACGYQLNTKRGGRLAESVRVGIVLNSNDGGKNWSVVYRSPGDDSFYALAADGSGCAWAVGEHGRIIHMCPTSR